MKTKTEEELLEEGGTALFSLDVDRVDGVEFPATGRKFVITKAADKKAIFKAPAPYMTGEPTYQAPAPGRDGDGKTQTVEDRLTKLEEMIAQFMTEWKRAYAAAQHSTEDRSRYDVQHRSAAPPMSKQIQSGDRVEKGGRPKMGGGLFADIVYGQ